MQKKKRASHNKQNLKAPKKLLLGNTPSHPSQLNLPSHNSFELRNAIKSIELPKASISSNPYKKPSTAVSRKSTSKSVRYQPNYHLPKMRSLMKQFKELKLMHQNQRSKSKSPASCKSKSVQKTNHGKKTSFRMFGQSRRYSENNLTAKLERTIKKLNDTNFFFSNEEDESLIPLSRLSNPLSSCRGYILKTESDQIVDMGEVRQFCSTASMIKRPKGLSYETFDIFKQTRAVIKIQRAWRKYQTKMLVSRYAFLYHMKSEQLQVYQQKNKVQTDKNEQKQGLQHNQPSQQVIEIPSQLVHESPPLLSPSETQKKRQQQELYSPEEQVKRMKLSQLQKWNQIIEIISNSRHGKPEELEGLLNKLALQSAINKKDLQMKGSHRTQQRESKQEAYQQHKEQYKESKSEEIQKVEEIRQINSIGHKRNQSSSSQSQGLQQYDSRKYIDYLDGDIYPQEPMHSPHLPSNNDRPVVRLAHPLLFHSQSLQALQQQPSFQGRMSSREELRHTTSQKNIKRVLSGLSLEGGESQAGGEEINLELLAKQFLEGSDPSDGENLDSVYSEQRLRKKLAQLNQCKKQLRQDQKQPEDDFKEESQEQHSDQEESEHDEGRQQIDGRQLKRSQAKLSGQILIQQSPSPRPPKLRPQSPQSQLSDHSAQLLHSTHTQEQGQALSAILMNHLIIQVLKQIASADSISQAFKKYSMGLIKPRVRRGEAGVRRKKGFPTTKVEIELFLQGLISYLARDEPAVFNNLLVPTGPSALQMLKYMHQHSQASQQSDSEQSQSEANVMVVPNRVFDHFWGLKEKAIIIEIPQNYDHTNQVLFRQQFQLLKSFNKIFYRSLFDTFNECLDGQRDYGIYGRPFPWKTSAQFSHRPSQLRLKQRVERARTKMVQLSTTYCGLIVQAEEISQGTISKEYIEQVHEDRLSRMLANDLLQGQERWIFYDDQETQILVEISNAVYLELIIQAIEMLADQPLLGKGSGSQLFECN